MIIALVTTIILGDKQNSSFKSLKILTINLFEKLDKRLYMQPLKLHLHWLSVKAS
jgi:hypothetical protein